MLTLHTKTKYFPNELSQMISRTFYCVFSSVTHLGLNWQILLPVY